MSLDLSGWRVAVVGGTGGIGRALSRFMASNGAAVTVVGQTLRDNGVARVTFLQADLSLMREAQRIGRELARQPWDLVVFTTGIFAAPHREETSEGIERDLAVSYLSRLVILRELAPRLAARPDGKLARPRVFIMGYPGAGQAGVVDDLNSEQSYGVMRAHMNTVAGNEALVLDSVSRYRDIDVFGLNPGMIRSNIRANVLGSGTLRHRLAEWLIGVIGPSANDYAARIVPLLVASELTGLSGTMFNRKGAAIPRSPKLTRDYVSRFVAVSEALVDSKR